MKKHPFLHCAAIIAVSWLYAGSVYMSRSFRLMAFYDERTVDIITSVFDYLLQAAGLALFCLGLRRRPDRFGDRRLFAALLVTGVPFMILSQLSNTGWVVQAAGYVFNLHIGLYFGFYITMLSRCVPPGRSGLCFGSAYAVGSVGTYLLSLGPGGDFMVSQRITVIYLLLAGLTVGLVLSFEEPAPAPAWPAAARPAQFRLLLPVIAIMALIFNTGSGLYYSHPAAASVNWYLIRAFYAVGLILAGAILDRKRFVGEILAIASLTYPLIMLTLVGDGVAGTVALALSYVFRGLITLYYIVAFTDPGHGDPALLPLAPAGLLIWRVAEALVSLVLLSAGIPEVYQLLFSALCFIPLLWLFVLMQSRRYAPQPVSESKRLALFSERYGLTQREIEMLKCLAGGLSDGEIAAAHHISKNTVRFHVSNLLKKTGAASRVEVVRQLEKS